MHLDSPFWLFAGSLFYPDGGWKDFKGVFATREAAHEAALSRSMMEDFSWYHIVDMTTQRIVEAQTMRYVGTVRQWGHDDEGDDEKDLNLSS